ncbi:ABC transporter substrate-binding protein [Nocardia sp. NBC_01377]|uniref:ABC transporter substrate-binding protein n=1 Tax=Nocardia sp. NBC_01377 TaxID=2903595 RepID=UPI00324421CE
MKIQRILVAAVTALLLSAVGCSRSESIGEDTGQPTKTTTTTADLGSLRNLCQSGTPSAATGRGVTADAITLGVFTDMGFTKNSELVDAAKVFTSWCNDHGGVNGRKLVPVIHDANLTEVRQRMLEACRTDFALVGGSAAFDALGVKDRLSCLLPDFPAQVDQVENVGSDLQVNASGGTSGMHEWLLNQAYPSSAPSVGLIVGDAPIAKVAGDMLRESLPGSGATIVYNGIYPATGVPDWTPYAQAIKSAGVKGMVFLGDYRSLAKLEEVLTSMDYRLDWVDANSNAYTPEFIQLAENSLSAQHNYADLSSIAPLSAADTTPAVAQVKELFTTYAPGKNVTYPALRAFNQWALFAKSANECGDNLTPRCVYTAATKQTAWTGGGLQAAVNLTNPRASSDCFNVQQATPTGWRPADFQPDTGPFRCDIPAYTPKGDYGKARTLADVGKSMSDVK